jgi:hypothetical protein
MTRGVFGFDRIGAKVAAALFVAAAWGSAAFGQSGPGWTQLLDGKGMDGWTSVGGANWRYEDGALVADKKEGKPTAHLVSKASYKDFMIHAEFWSSDDANSGIFIRCTDSKSYSPKTCYEVNIFDQRKDPKYGTGAIVDFAAVDPMPKAGGKWNTFEITAKGDQLVVVLNGQKTVDVKNGQFKEGPITLQYGSGVVKFRKVAIKPL